MPGWCCHVRGCVGRFQAEDLVERLAKRDQARLPQLPAPGRELQGIELQTPANARIGVEAQALHVGEGDQEQVERQSCAVTPLDVAVANQAVVNPVEAGRDLPDAVRSDQSFLIMGWRRLFPDTRAQDGLASK